MGKGSTSGVARNANLRECESDLFFVKLVKKLEKHKKNNPCSTVISLSVGDATEPIPEVITAAMEQFAHGLSTREGFSGYARHQGQEFFRTQIVEAFYQGLEVKTSEIFISDGGKSCLARLLMMFGSSITLAMPDPTYPVIAHLCKLFGQNVVHLPTRAEGGFFPDFANAPRTDLIYICNPNNPTGIAATRQQLTNLVSFARKNGSIIICDAVYASFISDNSPKSIFEIPGAREVAIEVNSFSKVAGFTGVRLGWVVVPESVVFADGHPIIKDYNQLCWIVAPAGASSIARAGGSACLTLEGMAESKKVIEYYKENARILLEAFSSFGLKAYGGIDSPYIWVEFSGQNSDDVCDEWLEKVHVLVSPGDLFGASGKNYIRVSSFGHRETIVEAVERLKGLYSQPFHDT